MRPAAIALTVLAIGALGTAGYFANEWRVCTNLENDYLNSMAGIRGHATIKQVLADQRLLDAMKVQEEAQWKTAEAALLGLHGRCGERSAETAHRKGQDVLMGTSPS